MNILHILSRFDSYDAISGLKDLSNYSLPENHKLFIASSLDSKYLDVFEVGHYQLPAFESNIINLFIAYRKLKRINDFEEKAKDYKADEEQKAYLKKFDFSKMNEEHRDEIEFLRIKDGYYKNNVWEICILGSPIRAVIIYAQHIYLKEFLENELKKGTKETNITGFKSTLNDNQIKVLFDNLKGNFIDINTNPDSNQNFKLIPWDNIAKPLGLVVDSKYNFLRYLYR